MQGILFKPEMTLANLKGLKTRTSRTRGLKKINENPGEWELFAVPSQFTRGWWFRNIKDQADFISVNCPFGQIGSELYGKETYQTGYALGGEDENGKRVDIIYKAGYEHKLYDFKWKSPMMMPEWASRYHIILNKIIVQRIQEISEEDSQKEGITERTRLPGYDPMYAMTFMILWDSINGKTYPWSSNPWVWVLYYRVEKK